MRSAQSEISFEYRAAWLPSILGGVLFSAGTIFMARQALTNERGLIINGIFELGVTGATRLNWTVAGILAIMALFCLAQIFLRLLASREVLLTASSISAPKHFLSLHPLEILFSDVFKCELIEAEEAKFLLVHSRSGASMKIPESYLGREDFLQLLDLLSQRITKYDQVGLDRPI